MLNGLLLQIPSSPVQGMDTVTDTLTQTAQQVSMPLVQQPVSETLTLLDLVIKGGPIMIPIALLSLIAVYVFIERYLAIKRASKQESNFMNNIRDFIMDGRIDSALSFCKNNDKPVARMIEKGIKRIGRPLKEIEESIEIVGKFEVYKLEKNLVILAIIAGIAPMFGFIGTIIGVIKIFHDISLAGDISITSVSSGLYTKMVSSAAGLIIGIFAFVCYHWLNIMVDKIVQKMEHNAMEFIDLLQEPTK
ncbi:MAG: MotA/TolQ/ExbB proton channel family protein [Lentimicrobiaceae bacterium]|nr:MotA/TolQ/ExbB proton channel family protein [Lentimicrobiaceae bacterium]